MIIDDFDRVRDVDAREARAPSEGTGDDEFNRVANVHTREARAAFKGSTTSFKVDGKPYLFLFVALPIGAYLDFFAG